MTTSGNGSGSETIRIEQPVEKPIRKDEIVLEERGLYIESRLPERRSRRKPLYLLHGELGGSWVWDRFLGYFARRGWEGHALNLRAHFWSETADFDSLDLATYTADALAGAAALARPPVVVGHGMGGLLAMLVAAEREVSGLVLISPALPAALLPAVKPHQVPTSRAVYQREGIGWAGPVEQLQRLHPDLTVDDVRRAQHLMGAESTAARRQMTEGVAVDSEPLQAIPRLVIGGGLDRQFPEEGSARVAEWLGAEYQPFGAHSHYGLVLGESSHEQVADTVRSFLESHRL